MPQTATLQDKTSRGAARPSTSSIYSPFGSSLPNRAWSDVSRGYRYGFNGKEKDTETANDVYDFGARIYDGRLGRWLSLDPFVKFYDDFTPYNFTLNIPTLFIDNDGNIVRDSKGNIVYVTDGAKIYVNHASGQSTIMEIGYVFADNGTKIIVYRNTDATKPGFNTNCHGTTFLDGQYWLNNTEVEELLQHDNYEEVKLAKDAKINDKVVIDDASGKSAHSVTIIQTNSNKDEMKVEGEGGVQTTKTKSKLKDAWEGITNSKIYHKKKADAVKTDEEIKKLKAKVYPPKAATPPAMPKPIRPKIPQVDYQQNQLDPSKNKPRILPRIKIPQ